MSAPCDRLARRLPALLDDPAGIDVEDRQHVEQCLRCQAAVAQHRRIRRTVHDLEPGRPAVEGLDPVDAVLLALDEQAVRRQAARRRMVLGLATATVLGLGAAAAARSRLSRSA